MAITAGECSFGMHDFCCGPVQIQGLQYQQDLRSEDAERLS